MLHQAFSTANIKLQEKTPLIHCLTNNVTINDAANAILAVGGSPIMSEHPRETADVTGNAQALVINIGNFIESKLESIFISGQVANERKLPIVFDPVGVTSSRLRKHLSERIIVEVKPTIIKGNMSEIKALANIASTAAGVDVALSDLTNEQTLANNSQIAYNLAKQLNCVIVASGAIDIVASPDAVYSLHNGTAMLAKITGTGCISGMLMGTYASVLPPLQAAILGISVLNIAGELAQEYVSDNQAGLGTFKVKLFDYLSTMNAQVLQERGRVQCINYI